VPSAPVARRCALDGLPDGRYVEIGLPVAAEFSAAHGEAATRDVLRRSLGLRSGRFLVLVTGGAEGSGGFTGARPRFSGSWTMWTWRSSAAGTGGCAAG
jgi:hypothetical protein